MNYDHYGVTIINLQCQDSDHALLLFHIADQDFSRGKIMGVGGTLITPFRSDHLQPILSPNCGPFCCNMFSFLGLITPSSLASVIPFPCAQQQKSYLCISRKGIVRPQSQFLHSCVCEQFINFQNQSTYFPPAE